MYKISYSTKSLKFLKRSDPKLRKLLMNKINLLAQDPFDKALDVKKLKGREGYRLRISDYRVLYTVKNDIVTIDLAKPAALLQDY